MIAVAVFLAYFAGACSFAVAVWAGMWWALTR